MEHSDFSSAFQSAKPHYNLLDGLRGVAAVMVLWYHVFEGYAFASGSPVIDNPNHAYLAVDFFFMLSGFVVSYAYDERVGKTLSTTGFIRRRLVRLHPMVILGALLGAVTFLMQGSVRWDGTEVAFHSVLAALFCAMFLIPAFPGCSYEVRGNGEMFPLNGPAWSLFFEYIGNLIYVLCLRRLNNRILALWTLLLGVSLCFFAVADISGYGNIGVGWTLDGVNFAGGLLRMLFPFSLGMLISRNFRPVRIRGAFWICTAVLISLFYVPYIPGTEPVCSNGIFEMVCIVFVFPAILWLGASGTTTDTFSSSVCKFLGDISYPVYIVHYPIYYLFYAWLIENRYYTFGETALAAILLMAGNILLAWCCLKIYDEPLRRRLSSLRKHPTE